MAGHLSPLSDALLFVSKKRVGPVSSYVAGWLYMATSNTAAVLSLLINCNILPKNGKLFVRNIFQRKQRRRPEEERGGTWKLGEGNANEKVSFSGRLTLRKRSAFLEKNFSANNTAAAPWL